MTAASKALPTRNPAVTAAEKAMEPDMQQPEERVIPLLSVPLKSRKNGPAAAIAASAPAGSVPGTVNDIAARCMASAVKDKAACERRLAASGPAKSRR
jgi:hypothetical protein